MKSLSAILAGVTLDTLRSLATWWGTELPERDDAEARQRLERAMRDAISARFVWERLDSDERQTLFAVVGPSARNWLLVELLAERSHLTAAAATAAQQSLIARGLLFTEIAKTQGGDLVGQRATFYGYTTPRNPQAKVEEKPILYVPTELATALYSTGRELFVPIADRSDKTLDELLMPYRQGDLDQIGRRFGLTLQAYYSRNEVRAAMAENLAQAEAVRFALTRLEPQAHAVYEWLRERDGRASVVALRQFTRRDGPQLAEIIRTLEEYALAFDTFSEGERIVFIPRETLANLRKAEQRQPAALGLRELPTPPATQPPDTTFLWDLAALVSAAYHQDIELTRSGALPKRAAQRVIPLLVGARARASEEDALAYIELLRQQACDLGLIVAPASTSRQRGRLAPGPKLDSWGRHDLVMQARRLYRRWPSDRWWFDQPGANYQEWMTFYLEPATARESVQQLLLRCQPGVWYSLASFRATLQGDDPYVLRPSQRYAGEAGFKLAGDLREQWERTDGEIITGIFRSTLAELGIVTLGYERDDVPSADEPINPDAFMLTELGYEALHSDLSGANQPSSKSLVVQPNFEALLMEPYMPTLYWMMRFADLEQVGRVSRFTLTRDALSKGLAHGGAIEDVIAYLETHTLKPLPQNVVYTLRDWARQYHERQRELTEGAQSGLRLIVAPDEALAGELVTSPKLRAFRLRQVGPKSVAIPPETSLRELRRALERLGYAKLLSGVEDLVAAAGASLQPKRRSRAAPVIKGA